jgi:hypothetical protein
MAVPTTAEAGGYQHNGHGPGYGRGGGYGGGHGHGGWGGHQWRPQYSPHWRHHGHYAPPPPAYYRPRPYAYAPAPSVFFGFRVP